MDLTISDFIQDKYYYDSNKKIYPTNNICYKIRNVQKFDSKKFAEWLSDSFRRSSFKSMTEMATAAKSNKATISRLMNNKAQTVTNKPSQPSRELVIKLAEIFSEDLDKALMLAGYAPSLSVEPPTVPPRILEALAREGTLHPDDEIMIAGIIEKMKKANS